jgi:hypothetical protein
MSWKYIAGFFDGEGSISVVTRAATSTSCVTISLGQSSDLEGEFPEVLVRISRFLHDCGIRHGVYNNGGLNGRVGTLPDGRTITTKRVGYHLQIPNRAGVETFLRGVRPFLVVKKTKCEDVLRFLKLYPEMRGRFSNRVHEDVGTPTLQAARDAGSTYHAIAQAQGMSPMAVYLRLNPEKAARYQRRYREKKRASAAKAA